MSEQFLKAIADVFHKLAEEHDLMFYKKNIEQPSQEERGARDEKKLEPKKEAAELVESILGFDRGSEINTKIANDQNAMNNLAKIAREQKAPKRMGEASVLPSGEYTPKTKQERYAVAYDKLGRYILGQD
jgi:hypothetical protein